MYVLDWKRQIKYWATVLKCTPTRVEYLTKYNFDKPHLPPSVKVCDVLYRMSQENVLCMSVINT